LKKVTLAAAVVAGVLSVGATKATDHRRPLYIRNLSSLSNQELADDLPAFQAAVSNDFAPAWGQDVKLVLIGKNTAPKGAWVIWLEDSDTHLCMCYGYHDFVNGRPIGYVYVKDSGAAWDITFTHELFEMLADPFVNRAALVNQTFFLAEVSDPVEANVYAYIRKSASGKPVKISDFILPAWYFPNSKGPFDFKRHLVAPLQILQDGYACNWFNGEWNCIDR
jgi:hypothetical protein